MKIESRLWPIAGIVLLVSGCAYTDSVFGGRAPRLATAPTESGAAPVAAPAPRPAASPAAAASAADPSLDVAGAAPGGDAAELRAAVQRLDDDLSAHQRELQRIDQKLDQDQATYSGLVPAIKAGLRPGSPPDDAGLLRNWNQAQTALDRITDDLAALTALSRVAAGDSRLAAQLGNEVQALAARPPANADASRSQATLGNSVEAARARSDTLVDTLNGQISEKGAFISAQRGSLGEALLAIRELHGPTSPAAAAPSAAAPAAAAGPAPRIQTASAGGAGMAAQPPSGFGDRRPFVVIRFDRPDVAYEDALAVAVKRAQARQPNIGFDVAAISANDGTASGLAANVEASKQHLAAVVRSLVGLGVPFERIVLSASSAPGLSSDEIRIYVH
jgi:hypothetical protein